MATTIVDRAIKPGMSAVRDIAWDANVGRIQREIVPITYSYVQSGRRLQFKELQNPSLVYLFGFLYDVGSGFFVFGSRKTNPAYAMFNFLRYLEYNGYISDRDKVAAAVENYKLLIFDTVQFFEALKPGADDTPIEQMQGSAVRAYFRKEVMKAAGAGTGNTNPPVDDPSLVMADFLYQIEVSMQEFIKTVNASDWYEFQEEGSLDPTSTDYWKKKTNITAYWEVGRDKHEFVSGFVKAVLEHSHYRPDLRVPLDKVMMAKPIVDSNTGRKTLPKEAEEIALSLSTGLFATSRKHSPSKVVSQALNAFDMADVVSANSDSIFQSLVDFVKTGVNTVDAALSKVGFKDVLSGGSYTWLKHGFGKYAAQTMQAAELLYAKPEGNLPIAGNSMAPLFAKCLQAMKKVKSSKK